MSAEPSVDTELTGAVEAMKQASKTSFLIAHERGLETSRVDALFRDEWAAAMDAAAGDTGRTISVVMESQPFACNADKSWPDYHRQWVAVRTRFIDDTLTEMVDKASPTALQMVNLGAGMDMRPYRLAPLSKLSLYVEVDSEEVTAAKPALLAQLGEKVNSAPLESLCPRRNVACDLTSSELFDSLSGVGWDADKPTIWLMEGLLMYLPIPSQRELILSVVKHSASGSFAIINGMCPTGHALEPEDMLDEAAFRGLLGEGGFDDVEFLMFGEPKLSYGRYPEGLAPCPSFSFIVGSK